MKFAAFDIEIAKELPEGCEDWREFAPLGISCAAIALRKDDGTFDTRLYHAAPALTKQQVRAFIQDLWQLSGDHAILSWNGTGFDFQVLAQESGLPSTCAMLALAHYDFMLEVTFRKGHYLGLDKALAGAGIEGKLHNVTLKDGTPIEDMGGAKAPAMWAAGEYDAVLAYLRRDVESLIELAEWVEKERRIRWTSNKGKHNMVGVPSFTPVEDLFVLPEPDTSWMTSAPTRRQFVEWMPERILKSLEGLQ